MRILHLLSYSLYSGPMPGVLGLIEAQLAAGHEVALAYDQVRGPLGGYEEALEARHFPAGVSILTDVKLSPKASFLDQFRDRKKLQKFVTAAKIEVVHCYLSHDHAMAELSLRALVPIVRTVHSARAYARKLSWPLYQANVLIARSEAHRNELILRGKKSVETVLAVRGGMHLHSETKYYTSEDLYSFRDALEIPRDAKLILNCAHMRDRGQKELIDAVAALEDIFLLFAGDGPDAPMLRQKVRALNLDKRVKFLGYQPFPELGRAYRAADLVVVGQAGNDGSARAALEAIDFALPLLVVSDGGSLDALASVAGSSVVRSPTKHAKDFCTALKKTFAQLPSLKRDALARRSHVIEQHSFFAEARVTDQAYRLAKMDFMACRRPRFS